MKSLRLHILFVSKQEGKMDLVDRFPRTLDSNSLSLVMTTFVNVQTDSHSTQVKHHFDNM